MDNTLLLQALKGEEVSRPPVWMMRQAGRYLPEYIAIREKYDFFTRVETPELATEITLQPVDIVGVDAAILFSDILVIPQAMGMEVQLVPKKGPYLPNPIRTAQDIEQLKVKDAEWHLQYVYDAISMTKKELNNRVPLIGFAGAPFTILCYMVEGQGSKTFSVAKKFCFEHPALAAQLLDKITDVTIAYLKQKVKAGADVIQVFDSWSGLLSPADFDIIALPYLTRIIQALKDLVPTILFPKGSWYALQDLHKTGANAIGIDWSLTPERARALTNNNITLQGNFDPTHLYKSPKEITSEVHDMINRFGKDKYIANLGHGILPDIPVDHAKAFVNAVKSYES